MIQHERVCEGCGATFLKKAGRNKEEGNRYCSRACYFSTINRPRFCAVYFPTCVCGELFTAKQPGVKACSDGCRREERRAAHKCLVLRRNLAMRPPSITCAECGVSFTPIRHVSRRLFCSTNCGDRFGRRVAKGVRRARQRLVLAEAFDPVVVFNRDGWHCRACRCPTPAHLRGTTNEYAPEHDHVVPIARGGAHTLDNAQTLCRACNNLKGVLTMAEFHPPIDQVLLRR